MRASRRLRSPRRRPRPGSLERPINSRLYRGAWLLAILPLLLAAFTVEYRQPLAAPTMRPAFDAHAAAASAREFAENYPNRAPGSAAVDNARTWVTGQMKALGYAPEIDRFQARIPGLGSVELTNVSARVVGRSPAAIIVVAHRDNSGVGLGGSVNDNSSGTAAMLELARAYAKPSGNLPARQPAHTIVFVSSDGGSFGAIGAERLARIQSAEQHVAAVIVLDSIAGPGTPRVLIAGDEARSPSTILVSTVSHLLRDQPGGLVVRSSSFRQLLDLAFPFSLYEQAPFVGRGIPAITITTAGDRRPDPATDTSAALDYSHLETIGHATEQLLAALDQGTPEPRVQASSYIYLGSRFVRGWTIQFALVACLFPVLAVTIDLFARCRRRGVPLEPALRSLGRRFGFWLFLLGLFLAFGALRLWPTGVSRPVSLDSNVARDWPLGALFLFSLIAVFAWLVARPRLLPREEVSVEESLAGYTAALLALCGVALVILALNRYSLLFLLPALHVWIWLPHLRSAPVWARLGAFALGLAGPSLLVWSFAVRYDLGVYTLWYLALLAAVGYVKQPYLLAVTGFAASAMQLAALSANRYGPYPDAGARPRWNLFQRTVRGLVFRSRSVRSASSTSRHDAPS